MEEVEVLADVFFWVLPAQPCRTRTPLTANGKRRQVLRYTYETYTLALYLHIGRKLKAVKQ